jgi:complement component 1 Q subcomponent-binding protein
MFRAAACRLAPAGAMRPVVSRSAMSSLRTCATASSSALARLAAIALPSSAMVFSRRLQSNLAEVAKIELEEEESRPDKMSNPTIPAGWSLEHKAGESFFTMKKKYNDEILEVYCQLQVLEAEASEEGDTSGAQKHYPFILRVERKSRAMEYNLTCIEAELVLDGLTMYDDAAVARDNSANGLAVKERRYAGPTVAELNGTLVDSMIEFLAARGVNDEFAQFIAQYSYDLEQKEYENWLKQVVAFCQ